MFLELFLYFAIFSASWALKPCDNELCNNAAVCLMQGSEPSCDCVGTENFKGSRCEEMVKDNCAKAACLQSAPCENFLGQFNCQCPKGFFGQKCKYNDRVLFTRVYLHYNRLAVYGEEEKFLIVLETLGDVKFTTELFIPTVVIDGFVCEPHAPQYKDVFKQSNDLRDLAKGLGLHHSEKIPFNKGYYHVSSGRFWEAGLFRIEMTISGYGTQVNDLYYQQKFSLRVYRPEESPCSPVVILPRCSQVKPFLYIDRAQYYTIEPLVQKRCFSNSLIVYKWSVMNYVGTVFLHHFPPINSSFMKIPPYRLWFDYQDEYPNVYLIRGEVREIMDDTCLSTIIRCYVLAISKESKAHILGGDEREVSGSEPIVLDGGISRNLDFPPDGDQHLLYFWDCESGDDKDNRHCRPHMGTEPQLHLPSGRLRSGKSYTFTLKIKSKINENVADQFQQVVRVVPERVLQLNIKCLENCHSDKFNPSKSVHLKAECRNCDKWDELTTYAWTRDGETIGDSEHVIFKPPNQDVIIITLNAEQAGQKGKFQLTLRKNSPPSNGNCKIQPKSGAEHETEFKVVCINYWDLDQPLWYEYVGNNLVLDKTGNSEVRLHLPAMSALKIRICDYLNTCADNELAVDVSPLTVPQNLKELKKFLNRDENNLQKLFHDGKVQQALVLADALLRGAASMDTAQLVMDQMQDFHPNTLLEVEQFTRITANLMKPMQPLDNRKAALFSQFFAKMADGFETLIRDGDVRDLKVEPYQAITTEILDMLTEFTVPLEKVPIVQTEHGVYDAEDPLKETYPDFVDFDETVLPRINNWLMATEELNRCIHYLGFMAVHVHEPEGEPFELERKDLHMRVFATESLEQQDLQSADKNIVVKVPQKTMGELRLTTDSDVLLFQVVTLQANPFWWYPHMQPVSTGILYFSVCSDQMQPGHPLALGNYIDFTMQLLPESAQNQATTTAGYINNAQSMVVYYAEMPMNSILEVTFQQPAVDLKVMVSLKEPPRGYELLRSTKVVSAQSDHAVFMIVNNLNINTRGFVAVMMAGSDIVDRLTFDFTMTLHECITWAVLDGDPQWTTSGCQPVLDSPTASGDKLHCRCNHFSVFAGRKMSLTAIVAPVDTVLLESIPINWHMVGCYLTSAGVFASFVWLAYRGLRSEAVDPNRLLIEISDSDALKEFNIEVRIRTGGHCHAGTTANVHLSLTRRDGVWRKFIIYQNPECPRLRPNSTCSVRLPLTTGELGPNVMRLKVAHDGAGRYPSWFCHTIEVEDLRTGKQTTFKPRQWITTKPVDVEETTENSDGLFIKFKEHLEILFINWFGFQAVAGPWQCGSDQYNRSERTLIWLVKVAVSVSIVACFYGRTTLETYEHEREIYHHVHINLVEIALLAASCFLASTLVQCLLSRYILNNKRL